MAVSILEKSPAEADEAFHALLDDASDQAKHKSAEPEDANLSIARGLKAYKAQLISALAQSVLTPQWLLKTYEQQLNKETMELDEEAKFSSEISSSLTVIDQCYRAVMKGSVASTAERTLQTQGLQIALQWFPFTFKDLTHLVDLHCLMCRQEKIENQIIGERIARIERAGPQHSTRFEDILEFHQTLSEPCHFLFQFGKEVGHFVANLLVLESLWLHSRQQLVTANSGLVLYIANQYKGSFLDFDDLVQEGHTGLLKAVDRYDPRLGFKFSTYAGYWIRQAISRSLSRCERVVRIPCGQVGTINKFYRIKEQLIARNGKEPSLSELAEHTGLSPDEIETIIAISQTAVPIEASTEDDEDTFAPIDYLEQNIFEHPFGILAQSDLEQLIEQAIKILNPREAKIIAHHFGVEDGQEMTLKEIGMELNLTRERVRQIEVAALNKIKRHYGGQLSNFL